MLNSPNRPVRVVVADVTPVTRVGLHVWLTRELGWSVVADTDNARDAVSLCRRLKPDLLIICIDMPGGTAAANVIKRQSPDTKVVGLVFADGPVPDLATRFPAANVLISKKAPATEFLRVLRSLVGEATP